jgi:hypothetical protein
MTERTGIRAFWLLTLSSAAALAVGGAALLRVQGSLAHAAATVDALARRANPARADRALAEWGRPWVETFLREHGGDPALADALDACQAGLLRDLDRTTTERNVVVQAHINQAEGGARACATPALGRDLAGAFVHDLRARWDLWLAGGEASP